MGDGFHFARLRPADLFAIDCQPAQLVQAGLAEVMTDEMAAVLAAQPVAWTAFRGDVPAACFGIAEQFSGRQGLGWSILSVEAGYNLLRLSRFIRHEIATCGLARVEIIARARDLEPILARLGHLDSGQLVELALLTPTREMRWAATLGVRPVHVLRCYGALSETYLLFEAIRPRRFGAMSLVERAA